MNIHPPVHMFVFGLPMMAIVVGVVLALLAITRRRPAYVPPLVQAVRPRPRYAVAYPVVTPVGGGRRYIWGVLIVLLILAAGTYRIGGHDSQPPAMIAPMTETWKLPPPVPVIASPMIPPPSDVVTPMVVRPAESVPRKKPNYLKPAPVNPPPRWQADIHCAQALALPENENTAVVRDVADRLFKDLRLRAVPPASFVTATSYVRISETGRDAIQHDADIGDYVPVRYHVELTNDGWQKLSQLERAGRADERFGLAARGLGLLTVLLGAVAGLVRMDELTKGYYTGRLFVVAAAAVAGIGWLIVSI